jgi:hypothetical protein
MSIHVSYIRETNYGGREMSLQELEIEALKLDLDGRATLAERLLRSLDELNEAENEMLWVEESMRRRKLLEEGKTTTRDADDVMRDAFTRLK